MINTHLSARLRTMVIIMALLLGGIAGGSKLSVSAQSGVVPVHDPSMIKAGNCYYVYSTGGTMSIQKLCEPVGTWTNVGSVFRGIPGWIYDVIGHVPPDLWAPDVNYFNGKYYLYYAGSTFGSNQSVIGLTTATDPAGPWTDQGEVLHSVSSDNYNAIDPGLAWDSDGGAWLSFGSFWDGIKMRQIDPSTGKLLASNSTLYSLASRGGGAIEASSILHVGDYYYLFVSFDRCCAGIDSTYKIMVGRAKNITGPYVDKDGTDMMNRGGTQLLSTAPPYIGPGGQDVFADGSTNQLAYHYYDGTENGKSKLAIREITIDNEGWPVLGPISNLTLQTSPTQVATDS